MGVRVIESAEGDLASLYDSVTMTSFGPVLESEEEAEMFLAWLPRDAREYEDRDLANQYAAFRDAAPRPCAECGHGQAEHLLSSSSRYSCLSVEDCDCKRWQR